MESAKKLVQRVANMRNRGGAGASTWAAPEDQMDDDDGKNNGDDVEKISYTQWLVQALTGHRQKKECTLTSKNNKPGKKMVLMDIVEENSTDMAPGGLFMEAKRLQVTHSKKELLLAMLPKNTDLSYI